LGPNGHRWRPQKAETMAMLGVPTVSQIALLQLRGKLANGGHLEDSMKEAGKRNID